MFFDPMYFLFIMPGMLLAMFAQYKVKSTFKKYQQARTSTGLSGAEAARRLLDFAGLRDVQVLSIDGFLSDHYDPSRRVLRLSPDVYNGRNLSAIGVACHEAGHAIQHAKNYFPMYLRSMMVPITQFSSNLSMWIIFAGFFLRPLLYVGIAFFAVGVVFSIVTLPVEWDASSRAKNLMVEAGIVSRVEAGDAGSVLNAAFMTYLASTITAVMTLLYYLFRAGLLGDDD
jgi:Zn-dependent membrane protease YugP